MINYKAVTSGNLFFVATGLSPRNVMATSNDQASWQMEWELPQKAANLEVAHEIRPYSESKVLEKDGEINFK